MVLVLPWLKHWVIANRYVFELEERYITQIGQSLGTYTHDMGVQFKHNISQAKVLQKARDEVDATFFSAHYPHPPPGRNYAIGMQMAHMFATLVHTTHAYEDLPVVAKDMVVPIYRVMLWGNNPFHLFTGYVEAGISNGEPSQSHKRHGICHPMVLVCSKDKVSGGYVNYIDAYFDRYIPFLSAFVCAHTFNETF